MGLTEPLPFPGHRVEAQEVSQDDGVGSGVGDDDNPTVGVVDLPEVPVVLVHRSYPVSGKSGLEACDDTLVKGTKTFSAG